MLEWLSERELLLFSKTVSEDGAFDKMTEDVRRELEERKSRPKNTYEMVYQLDGVFSKSVMAVNFHEAIEIAGRGAKGIIKCGRTRRKFSYGSYISLLPFERGEHWDVMVNNILARKFQ